MSGVIWRIKASESPSTGMDHSRRSLGFAVGIVVVLLSGAGSLVGTSRAHIKYVSPGSDPMQVVEFLLGVLTDPLNLALIAGTGGAGLVALAAYLRVRPAAADVSVMRDALQGYRDLIPWLLRLSLGLPLVGAGFNGYLFSPVVVPENQVAIRLFGITVGFLLLFGFATRLVAGIGFATYVVGLTFEPSLALAFEYVPGFLAIVLVGGGRPSADQVIARLAADDRTLYSRIDPFYRRVAVPFVERIERVQALLPTVLRAGMGVTFVYLGAAQKLMNPGEAIAVVGKYDLTAVIPVSAEMWVFGAGLAEVAVGVAIFLGVFTRAFAGLSLALFTLTLFGLPDDPVLAHISMFGLASVLVITGGGPFSVDARLQGTYTRIRREMLSVG